MYIRAISWSCMHMVPSSNNKCTPRASSPILERHVMCQMVMECAPPNEDDYANLTPQSNTEKQLHWVSCSKMWENVYSCRNNQLLVAAAYTCFRLYHLLCQVLFFFLSWVHHHNITQQYFCCTMRSSFLQA